MKNIHRIFKQSLNSHIYRKLLGFKPQYCGNIVVKEFCNIANRRKIFSFNGRRQPIAPSRVAKIDITSIQIYLPKENEQVRYVMKKSNGRKSATGVDRKQYLDELLLEFVGFQKFPS